MVLTNDKRQKLERYLVDNGAEILPTTNQYEALRFKGAQVGVLYHSGKVSNDYTRGAIESWKRGKKWKGGPVRTGRKSKYKKEKAQLIKRDGRACFYCGGLLGEDITLEHLVSLTSGGKNALSNMVLAHEICNHNASNLPLNKKVNLAIRLRVELITKNKKYNVTKNTNNSD